MCLNNSQQKPGAYSGIALRNATHCTVTGNHCCCDGEGPTQNYGIEEIGYADKNAIASNQCNGNARGGIRVVGPNTQVMANVGDVERGEHR